MNFAIVDDNKKDYENLSLLIVDYFKSNYSDVNITYFNNGLDLLSADFSQFNALFLDIDMPSINGLDLSKKIRETNENIQIVFVTNYASLAVKGYDVSAVGFLVKPVKQHDAVDVFEKIIKRDKELCDSTKLILKIKHGYKAIPILEIFYIDVIKHNLTYYTKNGDFVTRDTLKSLLIKLEGKNFIKCSNHTIVNLNYINNINGNLITLKNGDTLSISRKNKKECVETYINFIN